MASLSSSCQPSLPPLYFEHSCIKVRGVSSVLPAEVLHHCLVEYADWGDLARAACLHKDWSNIMYDAASQSSRATWELAQALMEGSCGLATNHKQAMKLLLQLADTPVDVSNNSPLLQHCDSSKTGNEYSARAMKHIASCYFTGSGVPAADPAAGLKWLQAAHEHGGDSDAAHEMAVIYENGQFGVEVDVVEAVTWFRKAAEAGHVEAMAELGLCYELGLAVEQSDEQALEWYMKAAEKGHLTAKYAIGEAFEEARGVPQSDAEACLWYYRAAIEGDEDSRRALRRLQDIARIVLPGVGRLLEA